MKQKLTLDKLDAGTYIQVNMEAVMKRTIAYLVLVLAAVACYSESPMAPKPPAPEFQGVKVFVSCGHMSIWAYQIDHTAPAIQMVGGAFSDTVKIDIQGTHDLNADQLTTDARLMGNHVGMSVTAPNTYTWKCV